jgi:hypothetical protein
MEIEVVFKKRKLRMGNHIWRQAGLRDLCVDGSDD